MLKFERNDNNELSVSFIVPQGKYIEKEVNPAKLTKRICDVIRSFKDRIAGSIKRRMAACEKNMMSHIGKCFQVNDSDIIYWERKDKTLGAFNIKSYVDMEKALELLKQDRVLEFIQFTPGVVQAVKALMNDDEQDHSDSPEGIRYSEMVSALLDCTWTKTSENS